MVFKVAVLHKNWQEDEEVKLSYSCLFSSIWRKEVA